MLAFNEHPLLLCQCQANSHMTYRKNRLSHKKELYYILCIVALIVILLFGIWGPRGYRDLAKARLQLQEQRQRVDELKRNNYERMRSIEGLKSDKDALEKHAREKGYGREGDIIQQLPEKPEKQPKK
jgi:cell division protein FtsB